MQMAIQAYHGYFKDGQFLPLETVTPINIPDNVEVHITVTEKRVNTIMQDIDEQEISERLKIVESLTGIIPSDVDALRTERITTIKNILAEVANAEDELTDSEWKDMLNLRKQMNNGLAREIKI